MNVWRSRLDRWLGPLAEATPLTPNSITLVALALVLAAATSLALGRDRPILFLVALPLLAAGGLLDALDGIVARRTGQASPLGDFLDHFADRVADLALVCGWCLGASIHIELSLLFLLAVSLNGYAGTQIEATFHIRDYDGVGRGEFVLALIILPLLAFCVDEAGLAPLSIGGLRITEWATVAVTLAALAGLAGRLRRAVRLASEVDPSRTNDRADEQ